jgi:polysaccharide biosynthesis transport protein
MLQFNKTSLPPVGEGGSAYDVQPTAELSSADLFATALGFIRRQLFVILSIVPLTIGLAAAYLYKAPRLYDAQATIVIDPGKVQVFKQSILGDDPVSAATVDSKIQILKSDDFAQSVIRNLNLAQDRDFVGSSPGLAGTVINLLGRPLGLLHSAKEPKSESDFTRALLVLEKGLTVSRVGSSYAVEIEFQSNDPDRAAHIANAVADTFIVDQLNARYQALGKAAAWLQDRLNELRAQASAAERAVVEYKAKNNIVSSDGHLINEQQLTELNTALGKAHADTMEARARLDRMSEVLRGDDLDPATTEIATIADALHNQLILKFRQQYLELAQREALLSNRLGTSHLAVVSIRNQMREVRRSILEELKQIAAAYQSDYEIARARENSLQESLNATVAGSQTTNKAQIELRQLESSAQSYRALYDNFQQRYIDSLQQQSFPLNDIRVITRASPPSAASSPKFLRVLGLATMAGLGLGFGLAMIREIGDRVFRTSSQVVGKLRTECVALVPMISNETKAASRGNVSSGTPAASRILKANAGLLRYVVDWPLSRFSEAIRAVKVSVDLSSGGKSCKVIGITSSLPNEGKSTISMCLAQLCAYGGARVILLDCDLRLPALSRDLSRNATLGLLDVISGSVSVDEVIWSDPVTQLRFLPGVVTPRVAHASEVLASQAMKRFVERLRESYDYIIIDLSPLAPVVDVRTTTHLLDGYLLVVEWGKTKIDVVEHALGTARGVYDNLLGVLLNKVDFKRFRRYESGRNQYYYNAHYSRYGYTD